MISSSGEVVWAMGMDAIAASLISSVNLRSRSSRDRLLSVSPADNSCSLSANCFQFALSVSHLDCPRLSGTFVKASDSIITVACGLRLELLISSSLIWRNFRGSYSNI